MAVVQYYAVQPFVRTAKGRLCAGNLQPCSSAEQAKRLASRLVDDNRAVGALAFSSSGSEDENVFDDPLFLARVGEVPESDDF